MIMPDDDMMCKDAFKDHLGYHALYDTCEDSELSEGVILCAVIKGITYMFQLEDTTNILSEESIMLMEGTLFEYLEETPCEEEIDYFPISNCRFPTKEELDWYSKMDTV
nr:MAG TPA: hypothetical protein [Caudoviricetes sp.]